MTRIIALVLLLAAAASARFWSPDRPGPFAVDRREVRVPLTSGPRASLLYVPLGEGLDRQPCVVLGHGFLAPIARYDSICRWLTGHGYYVLVPGYPEPGLFYARSRVPRDLLAAMDFLDSLAREPGYSLDPHNVALVGHSMGGGAAFAAAGLDTLDRVTAVAALSPYRVARVPGSLPVPVLIFIAGGDRVAAPVSVRQGFFDACSARSQLITIPAGGHSGYLDDVPGLAGRYDSGDRPTQLRAVRTYLAAFLGFWLDGDYRNSPWLFEGVIARDSTISVEYGFEGIGALNFLLFAYPDPARRRVYLRSPNRNLDSAQVYDGGGRYLRTLAPASAPRWAWDCSDSLGTRVPAGDYVFHAFTNRYGLGVPGVGDIAKQQVRVLPR